MNLKYTWNKHPKIKKDIIKLCERSYIFSNRELNSEVLNELEDYIQSVLICGASEDSIVNMLNNINYIKIGNKINGYNPIILDGELLNSGNMSDKNKADFYFKLSLNLLRFNDDSTLEFSQMYKEYIKDNKNIQLLVNDGWQLLQMIMSYYISKMIFNTKNCFIGKSRFPSFMEEDDMEISSTFRAVVNMFGQTINGIAIKSDHTRDSIVDNLIIMAISGNFSQRIIGQYVNEDREFDLYKLLYLFGILLNTKYEKLGLGSVDNLHISNDNMKYVFNQIYSICGDLTRVSEHSVDFSSPILINRKVKKVNNEKKIKNLINSNIINI